MKNRFYISKISILVAVTFGLLSYTYFYSLDTYFISSNEKKLSDFNYAISTQTVGPKYQFTDETTLVETAQQIKDMGSNLLKFSMHPRYCTENYGLPENKQINSLTKLATLEPSSNKVLNMDFKFYHISI